jgi:tRNA dimethylallyltransferase
MRSTGDLDGAELPVRPGAEAPATAPEVCVICGPTAAGKSAIAMHLATRASVTIISADSRQIYRGFDVGTAKPTAAEQREIPHRGIDVADSKTRYSAAAWAAAADGWIGEARAAARIPLVVGGSGLYLRALFDGLFEEPALDHASRASLSRALADLTVDELRRWVTVLDPARAHLGRTQLLRAIEIAVLTGRRLSDLHRENAGQPRWRPRYLLVDAASPVALGERIGARIDDMLDHGWPDEVQRLTQTVPESAPAWNATGYDTVRRMLAGELTRAETRAAILIATRQFAKRQRTWFRNQLPHASTTRLISTEPEVLAAAERWFVAEGAA